MQPTPESMQPPIGTTIERGGTTFTMTEEGWRAEVQHSMMRRCRGWDYCQPWIYQVTIGCQRHEAPPMPHGIGGNGDEVLPLPAGWQYPQWLQEVYRRPGRPHLFGELTGSSADEARIELNPLGQAVNGLIETFRSSYPQLHVIESIVMPNHLHMVIQVRHRLPDKSPLGIVMNKFKSWVNRSYKQIALGLPASTLMDLSYQRGGTEGAPGAAAGGVPSSQSGTEGVPSSQSGTEITAAGGAAGSGAPHAGHGPTHFHAGHGSKNPKVGLVFEPGFNDRILFRQGQLQHMIDYCRNNPKRLWQVVHNRQYFERVMKVPIVMPYLASGGTRGQRRWLGETTELLAPVTYALSPDGEPTETVTFSVMGNRSLLHVPERMQIQCSRSITASDLAALQSDVLKACQHGVVPVTPCISPGEKQISRAVLEAGKPLIVIFPNGIPHDMRNKQGFGQYFDACSAGQLLILAPWEYQERKRTLQRWQCLFLNDIAAQLTLL